MPQCSLVATLTDPTRKHALSEIASYSTYANQPDLDDDAKLDILNKDLRNLQPTSVWANVETYMQFQVNTFLDSYNPSTNPNAPSRTPTAYFLACFNYLYGYFFKHFGHDLWDNHTLRSRAWEYAKVRSSSPLPPLQPPRETHNEQPPPLPS
jgi:hypothetical protein